MAFEVFFRDKTSTIVDTGDGEKLKELLLKQKTATNVEINDEMYRTSEIVSIKHATNPTVPVANWDVLPLAVGKKCHGKRSIQNEINLICRNDYPDSWFKLIRDNTWREQTRKKLLDTNSDKWCDYRQGTCVCD